MSRRLLTGVAMVAVGTALAVPSGAVGTARPGASTQDVTPGFMDASPPHSYVSYDAIHRINAGEPSVGVNWRTGAVLYMAGTQISRVTFGQNGARWTDVTPPQQSAANEDAILFTDHATGRTMVAGLLLAGANTAYTDDDGSTWQPASFPEPHSPDHESIGGGPYATPAPPAAAAAGYRSTFYYCAQNMINTLGAFCGRSDTGGATFNPSVMVFGANPANPCNAIHGHIKVGPDGTLYLPNRACTRSDGVTGQGLAISHDNGASWTYSVVPDSRSSSSETTDPSVGVGAHNTVYFGYQDASGAAKIAVSRNEGRTWSPSVTVGAPYQIRNVQFPEVVAGDDGRAAFSWVGTTSDGNAQSESFRGTWNLYVSYTYGWGQHWVTLNVTPGNAVQRGCLGNGQGPDACRNQLDFNDATVDKTGRVLLAYTDGCADINYSYTSTAGSPHGPSTCDRNPNASTALDHVSFDGLARQSCGRGLFAAYDRMLPRCPARTKR
jgi:hypothetical protein